MEYTFAAEDGLVLGGYLRKKQLDELQSANDKGGMVSR